MGFNRELLRKLISERDSLEGMREAFRTIQQRQLENADRIGDFEDMKKLLTDMKARSVGDSKLIEQAVSMLEENGFKVVNATNSLEAVDHVMREIGNEKLVVKSKSNISKEIGITKRLEKEGVEVVETDLGDRIIQLSGTKPSHPTGPAVHLNRIQISEILSRHFGRELSPSPDILTETVREELDGYFRKAKVSITGVNAIAAQEGALVMAHNEGNIGRCSQVSGKQIILASYEKIVPTISDALAQVKIQTYCATGKPNTAHIDIISGCSYTADIEKKIFRGMHGPKEIVIIFIDSGRSKMKGSELLYCIGCGNCLLNCPVYDVLGPNFGTDGHLGGIGVAISSNLNSVDEADEQGLFLCTSCGNCQVQCPVSIDIRPELFLARGKSSEKALLPEAHKTVLSSIKNYENPWLLPRSARSKWAKDLDLPEGGELIFFPGCSLSLLHPEIAKQSIELLKEAGLNPGYLGDKEICCGSIARKLGDQSLFVDQVSKLFDAFEDAGAEKVVVSCPGCLTSLIIGKKALGKEGIDFIHISQVLADFLSLDNLACDESMVVTYHDPCELGRGLEIFDPPRKLIGAVKNVELREMDRARDQSACCGAGAGVKSEYPELSKVIAEKRSNMGMEKGARIMLTSCPWCLDTLSESAAPGIIVQDLIEFIHQHRLKPASD